MLMPMKRLKKDTIIHPITIVAGPPIVRPYPKRSVIAVTTLCAAISNAAAVIRVILQLTMTEKDMPKL
jgi:hypothetical protein